MKRGKKVEGVVAKNLMSPIVIYRLFKTTLGSHAQCNILIDLKLQNSLNLPVWVSIWHLKTTMVHLLKNRAHTVRHFVQYHKLQKSSDSKSPSSIFAAFSQKIWWTKLTSRLQYLKSANCPLQLRQLKMVLLTESFKKIEITGKHWFWRDFIILFEV